MVSISGHDVGNTPRILLTDTAGRLSIVMRAADDAKMNYTVLGGILETTIWTPAAGKKWVLTDLIVSATANCGITIRDNTAGATIMTFIILANTTLPINLQTPIVSGAANRVLTAQTSAITVAITTSGYEQ